jgi:hypothetical protein
MHRHCSLITQREQGIFEGSLGERQERRGRLTRLHSSWQVVLRSREPRPSNHGRGGRSSRSMVRHTVEDNLGLYQD